MKYPEQVKKLILMSWANGTKKQYNPHIHDWIEFCQIKKIDPIQADILVGAEFLANKFMKGLGYSAVNSARCALSAFMAPQDGITFGKNPTISRLLKGVFRSRPALPKYVVTYDAGIVLNYLRSLPTSTIFLKLLTLKLATLLMFLFAQRAQTLHELNIDYIHIDAEKIVFYNPAILKNTTPNYHLAPLEFYRYHEEALCLLRTTEVYKDKTQSVRDSPKLLLSFVPPHRAVSAATVARWVKTVMKEAGVDITIFSAHSARAAVTSKTKAKGVSLLEIQKAAGWRNAKTFQTFYQKPIVTFSEQVLLCVKQ